MTSNEPATEWRWIDAEGRQRRSGEREFHALLSARRLEGTTLVWKTGWLEWLRANEAAELADLLPRGSMVSLIEPRSDPKVRRPPPIDHGRLAAGHGAGASLATSGSRAQVPLVDGRTALRRRPAMPTLIDTEDAASTGTLRPPAAVPPPPRGIPTYPQSETEETEPERQLQRARRASTPVPPRPVGVQEPEPVPPDPAILQDLTDQPASTTDDDAEGGLAHSAAAQDGSEAEAAVPSFGMASGELASPPAAAASAGRRLAPLLPYVALGAAMGILGAASAAWWKTPPNEKRRAPEPATPLQRAPRPEQPEATTDGSCRLTKAAQRLSPSIVLSIPPNVAVDPVQGHAAIGFADTPTDGLGIIVDPSTLLAGHVFRNHSRSDVLGVVPVTSSGRLDFVVTGSDTGFDTARAVDAKVPFALGYRNGDFVRFSNDAHETVWSNVAHQRVTEPRVATVTGFGHVVTFRSDGQEGTIRYGWLTPDGHKKTDLASLSVHGRVGTPAIAAQQGATLTAFAVRSEAEPTWHIELALAHGDGPPESTHRFSLPQGGPGQEAMSPVAEALSHGRWILQWTEGPAGRRDVRIQALSQDLKTMGPAITVSPKNANAGQGVVWVSGKKALSTFLVASQHSHELWGTALECP